MSQPPGLLELLDRCVVIAPSPRYPVPRSSRRARKRGLRRQVEDGPQYELIHAPRYGVTALLHVKSAVLEALRHAPFSVYGQLAVFAPDGTLVTQDNMDVAKVFPGRYEGLKAALAPFPLSDSELGPLLQAIANQHFVVSVACGGYADWLRQITSPGLPADVPLPAGEFLLLGYGPWDGLHFRLAVERIQRPEYDSSYSAAVAVVESGHGKPWDDPRSRFSSFPEKYRDAFWWQARRQAGNAQAARLLVNTQLVESFIEEARNLASRPVSKRKPTGWGEWLSAEDWPRVRLQSTLRSRVQKRVMRSFLVPREPGTNPDVATGRTAHQDRRRGSRSYREAVTRLNALSRADQQRVGEQMRGRLDGLRYSLFEAWVRRENVAAWARERGISPDTACKWLKRTVRPALFETVSQLAHS